MIEYKSIRVYGKVQGVWFRASTRQKAGELGIKGYVRNEYDGSVYIEAAGTADQLQEFFDWCRQGPELAVVKTVEIQPISVSHFTSFEIDQ